MQFGSAFRKRLPGNTQRIFDVVSISVGLTRRAKETAELTIDLTNVGWIEMPVDIEIGCAAVLLASYGVSQLAESVQVIRGEKSNSIVK